MYTAYKEKTDK